MMKTYLLLTFPIVAIGLTVPLVLGHAKPKPRHVAKMPVLVELFTSEGCSSCPPADALLAKLQMTQPVDGALIIPLSEHVDYFNSRSWQDRFSSPTFSKRQASYVNALHVEGSYTPQMVVDGQTEFVGSNEDAAIGAIAKAAQNHKATVALTTQRQADSSVKVAVQVSRLPAGEGQEDIYLAVTEDKLGSNVNGGENSGRHLTHTAVVRSLLRVGVASTSGFEGAATVKLERHWKPKDLSFVAFVQARSSKRILGTGLAQMEQP